MDFLGEVIMDLASWLWLTLSISVFVLFIYTLIIEKWCSFVMTPVGVLGILGSCCVICASIILLMIVESINLIKLVIGIF